MPSVIFTADLHGHNQPYPNSLELFEQLLQDLYRVCLLEGAKTLIIAGDLYHSKQPPLIVALSISKALRRFRNKGITVYWLRGNHETSIRSHPAETHMSLFRDVCKVLITPRCIELEGVAFYFIPWYPAIMYHKWLSRVHRMAFTDKRKKVLITHVGLKEGKVSPSNVTIEQPVSVVDLRPTAYRWILLGDYHAHQYVADNVLYMGSPIPHNFGDFNNVGVWKLLLPALKLQKLILPSVYPGFSTYTVTAEEDLPILGYNSNNRNKIRSSVGLYSRVTSMYPDAIHEPIDTGEAVERGRLVGISEQEPEDVALEYLKSLRLKKKEIKRCMQLLLPYLERVGITIE